MKEITLSLTKPSVITCLDTRFLPRLQGIKPKNLSVPTSEDKQCAKHGCLGAVSDERPRESRDHPELRVSVGLLERRNEAQLGICLQATK